MRKAHYFTCGTQNPGSTRIERDQIEILTVGLVVLFRNRKMIAVCRKSVFAPILLV